MVTEPKSRPKGGRGCQRARGEMGVKTRKDKSSWRLRVDKARKKTIEPEGGRQGGQRNGAGNTLVVTQTRNRWSVEGQNNNSTTSFPGRWTPLTPGRETRPPQEKVVAVKI